MNTEITRNSMDNDSALSSAYTSHCQVSGISLFPDLINTMSTIAYPDYQSRPMSISSTTQLIPTDSSPNHVNHQFVNRSQSNILDLYTSRVHIENSVNLRPPPCRRDTQIMRCQSVGVHTPQSNRGSLAPPNHIRTRNLNVGVTTPNCTPTTQPDYRAVTTTARNCATLPGVLPSHLPEYTPPTRAHTTPHSNRYPQRTSQHTSVQTQTSHAPRQQETCKEPCIKCLSAVTSFKCLLVSISLVGVCCVVTGIVLGALHAISGSFLFLSIMFLALGVVLVIVVFVGWKCTPRGHEPCHVLLGLGDHFRHRRSLTTNAGGRRTRDSNWYGGVLYPEFRHRRPPPSYTASMQDYHQRLMQAQQQYINTVVPDSTPNSPPPTYRSHSTTTHAGLQVTFPLSENTPNSRPPTYRSTVGAGAARPRPVLPVYTDGNEHVQIHSAGVSCISDGVVNISDTSHSASNGNWITVPAERDCDIINIQIVNVTNDAGNSIYADAVSERMTSLSAASPEHIPVRVCTNTHNDAATQYTLPSGRQTRDMESDQYTTSTVAMVHEECIETLLASTMRTFDEITMDNTVLNDDYNAATVAPSNTSF